MTFTAKILSWRFRHLNIVGCLLKKRPTKKGSRAPQDPPLATPLGVNNEIFWSEIGLEFGELDGTPSPWIPRSPPPRASHLVYHRVMTGKTES